MKTAVKREWQGPSGRWFTTNDDGHPIPMKAKDGTHPQRRWPACGKGEKALESLLRSIKEVLESDDEDKVDCILDLVQQYESPEVAMSLANGSRMPQEAWRAELVRRALQETDDLSEAILAAQMAFSLQPYPDLAAMLAWEPHASRSGKTGWKQKGSGGRWEYRYQEKMPVTRKPRSPDEPVPRRYKKPEGPPRPPAAKPEDVHGRIAEMRQNGKASPQDAEELASYIGRLKVKEIQALKAQLFPQGLKGVYGAKARQAEKLAKAALEQAGVMAPEQPITAPEVKPAEAPPENKPAEEVSQHLNLVESPVEFLPGGGLSEEQARVGFDKIFGGKIKPEHIGSLMGMPPNAKVRITVEEDRGKPVVRLNMIMLDDQGERIGHAVRSISIDHNDEKFCYNNDFILEDQGKGTGSDIFEKQVSGLAAAGISYLQCHAAGNSRNIDPATGKVRVDEYNGYYTWPRLGYDELIAELSDEELRGLVQQHFPDAQSVLDVMSSPEGRTWWKNNALGFDPKFDLKEGSRSRKVLDAYQQEKRRLQQASETGGGNRPVASGRGSTGSSLAPAGQGESTAKPTAQPAAAPAVAPAPAPSGGQILDSLNELGEDYTTDYGPSKQMTGINLVRAMKARGVSKEQVEKELERLFDEDKIVVHRHDQPSALTENERADLPVVMGTPIAGVYTRGSAEKNVPPPVEEPQPESVPSPLTSEPSAKVSEAVGRGDVTARNELLLRHQDKIEDRVRSRLRRLGLSTDEADEIAQQVNLKLVEAVDRGGYNPEQGPFVNYLSRVASNAVTDMLRDRGRRRASSIGASDEPGEGIDVADTRASHEDNVETQESLGQMRGVLGGLEPQQQKIMSAMQQHGMNQAQAAQALGMNRATFNRHYLATLAEMRRRMGVVEEEEE